MSSRSHGHHSNDNTGEGTEASRSTLARFFDIDSDILVNNNSEDADDLDDLVLEKDERAHQCGCHCWMCGLHISCGGRRCLIFFVVMAVIQLSLAAVFFRLAVLKKHGKMYVSSDVSSTENYPNTNYNDTQDIDLKGYEKFNSSRMEDIKKSLLEATEEDVLVNKTTPQHMALMWLVDDDGRQLDPQHPNLLQRYTLATLYFATRGPSWRDTTIDGDSDRSASNLPTGSMVGSSGSELLENTNWLSPTHECEWNFTSCRASIDSRLRRKKFRSPVVYENQDKRPPESGVPEGDLDLQNFGDFFDDSLKNEKKKVLDEVSVEARETANEDSLVGLHLESRNLVGHLPPELGVLDTLETLDLSSNELKGPIPITLASANELRNIMLNDNHFSGPVPIALGSLRNLEKLMLHNNELTGTIPAALGNLTHLVELGLHENELVGPVPLEVCNLQLRELYLPNMTCACCNGGTTISTESTPLLESGTSVAQSHVRGASGGKHQP